MATAGALTALTFTAALTHGITNVDNLFVLTSVAAILGISRVLLAWALSQLLVLSATLVLSIGVVAVPGLPIGALGIVPLGIGILLLVRRYRSDGHTTSAMAQHSASVGSAGLVVTLLSLSGDTLGALTPLLADSEGPYRLAVLMGAAISAAIMAAMATYAAQIGPVQLRLSRLAERWLPWVLIAVGCYVLANTGTDAL